MENERRITAPEGCEIEKVELVDGVAVVTFKHQDRKLPKSWDEFCEMYPKCKNSYYINDSAEIEEIKKSKEIRYVKEDKNILPDRATAEAVLALIQLIQLRNAYNGDWVPNWTDNESKYTIDFIEAEIYAGEVRGCCTPLFFKSKELRDEFLRYFRPLIEKLKPLYGIKEGGEEC